MIDSKSHRAGYQDGETGSYFVTKNVIENIPPFFSNSQSVEPFFALRPRCPAGQIPKPKKWPDTGVNPGIQPKHTA